MVDSREVAVEAYIKALRTAEGSAVARAAEQLAAGVVLQIGQREIAGRDDVAAWLARVWPMTSVYLHGSWSAPRSEGERLVVRAEFPLLGAAPKSLTAAFSFDEAGRISRIEQHSEMPAPAETTDTIPDVVRGLVNGALANGTPIVLAYVDADGAPHQALRGSTQVYSPHQLCIWLRPGGNLPQAVQHNPRLSLLYRDSKTRTTLIFRGRGHIETDPAVRDRVYNLVPEVEQTHDPEHRGNALIIDIERLQGTHPRGPIRMERPG
jgi:hypothetical protein